MSHRYILCPLASRTFFVHPCTMSERDRVQFKFMIPADLKEALEQAAHEERRSLSAEIIARLEESFRYDPQGDIVQLSDKQVRMLTATLLDRMLEANMLKPDVWEHTGSKPGETAAPDAIPADPSANPKRAINLKD